MRIYEVIEDIHTKKLMPDYPAPGIAERTSQLHSNPVITIDITRQNLTGCKETVHVSEFYLRCGRFSCICDEE